MGMGGNNNGLSNCSERSQKTKQRNNKQKLDALRDPPISAFYKLGLKVGATLPSSYSLLTRV